MHWLILLSSLVCLAMTYSEMSAMTADSAYVNIMDSLIGSQGHAAAVLMLIISYLTSCQTSLCYQRTWICKSKAIKCWINVCQSQEFDFPKVSSDHKLMMQDDSCRNCQNSVSVCIIPCLLLLAKKEKKVSGSRILKTTAVIMQQQPRDLLHQIRAVQYFSPAK